MLRIEHLYWVVAAFLVTTALLNLRDRRVSMAAFWVLLAVPFVFGEAILAAMRAGSEWPAQAVGIIVIVLGVLASMNPLRSVAESPGTQVEQQRSADRLGNRLFIPALALPTITLLLYLGRDFLVWRGVLLLDPKALTLTSLGVACVVALALAMVVTRARPLEPLAQGRRLLDSLGWAVLLPMVLATLGGVFITTGVGSAIASVTAAFIPIDNRIACLLAFALGMVLFTVIMGNAFAAFPVMMAGIGLPLLIVEHGANPALLGAVGMLTGYCGTLLTPMAANFNIVPAVLLELPDQYGVIRAQAGTAFALIAFNVGLLLLLVFR
ncbi:MAG: DUF979 domain-containing protein [Dokdonella sp.]